MGPQLCNQCLSSWLAIVLVCSLLCSISGPQAAPVAGMLKLLSMAAALPTQDHWILQMDAAALHRKAVDSKRNAEFLKQVSAPAHS